MKTTDKWEKMVKGSKVAIENFNDFSDDKAIVYADNRIKELEKDIETLVLRLMGEDKYSHSPDTLKVLDKLVPGVASKHGINIDP